MNWIRSFHFIDLAIFSESFHLKIIDRRYYLFIEYLVYTEQCAKPFPHVIYSEMTICGGGHYFSSFTDEMA